MDNHEQSRVPVVYSPMARGLHWVTAVLILALLVSGFLAGQALEGEAKRLALASHATFGLGTALAVFTRLVWWWRFEAKPEAAGEGWQLLLAKTVHILLYIVPLGMVVSGIGMFVLTGAGPIVFGGGDGPLPNFHDVPARIPHGIGGRVLVLLVVMHVGAALYHHFIKRDGLLARVGVGKP